MHELKLITIYRHRALRELKETVVIYHRERAGEGGGGGSEGVGRILSFSWGNEGNKLSLKNINGRLLKLTVKEGITRIPQRLREDQVKFIVTQPKSSDPPTSTPLPGIRN